MMVIYKYPWESDFDALSRFLAKEASLNMEKKLENDFIVGKTADTKNYPLEMDFIKQFYNCTPTEEEKRVWLAT